ncbi:MAG: hypothetical protein A2516_03770 [Alphaproteobacteria bacterium RIFOXYD12_FULL_60_8]|nr:MAG: hypothetical protein A2516_03770 [Alphaproteobacteria bacterium RIFOXYD12_FULL_60_8]
MRFVLVTAAALAAVLSQTPAQAGTLSARDVKAQLTGRTASGADASGRAFVQTFAPDGAVLVKGMRVGSWSVASDGSLCQKTGARPEVCTTLENQGTAYTASRDGQMVMTFSLK